MSKKKSRKKQQFKYGQPQTSRLTETVGGEMVAAPAPRVLSKAQQLLAGVDDFSYVRADLIRVAGFAAICVVLEVGLWLVFNKSGVGMKVYSLFKI